MRRALVVCTIVVVASVLVVLLAASNRRRREPANLGPRDDAGEEAAPWSGAPPALVGPIFGSDWSPPADDEQILMSRLRALPPSEPLGRLTLAREGNRRFPDSHLAQERWSMTIDALVALDRIGEAHTEASAFIDRYPQGQYARHVMALMGVHPRPRPGPRP